MALEYEHGRPQDTSRSTIRFEFKPDDIVNKQETDPAVQESDYGHAKALEPLWKGKWRWRDEKRVWMHWNGKVWVEKSDREAYVHATEDLLQEYNSRVSKSKWGIETDELDKLRKQAGTLSRIKSALQYLSGLPGIFTTAEEWDSNPWLLNLENGVLNLDGCRQKSHQDLELLPHAPEYLCTKIARVRYDPNATAESWRKHLALCQPDAEIERELQRELGMSLVGSSLDELLPIWYGRGANGKSTTTRVIQEILGRYAGQAAPNLLVKEKHSPHPTGEADLMGYRIVFSSEIDSTAKLDEAKVKRLTGGDRQKARYMKKDFFDFKQTWLTLLLCNHRPEILGTDDGIWRRVRVIPWETMIPRSARKPQDEVIEELLQDSAGILLWMLEGLTDFLKDQDWIPEAVRKATDVYRQEQDRIMEFLFCRCELKPGYSVKKGDLYKAYLAWCSDAGDEPLSQSKLSKLLSKRPGIAAGNGTGNVHIWDGIKLKEQG